MNAKSRIQAAIIDAEDISTYAATLAADVLRLPNAGDRAEALVSLIWEISRIKSHEGWDAAVREFCQAGDFGRDA